MLNSKLRIHSIVCEDKVLRSFPTGEGFTLSISPHASWVEPYFLYNKLAWSEWLGRTARGVSFIVAFALSPSLYFKVETLLVIPTDPDACHLWIANPRFIRGPAAAPPPSSLCLLGHSTIHAGINIFQKWDGTYIAKVGYSFVSSTV